MQQLERRFAEVLRRLDPPQPFALAVSGGPDSTALMRLAAPLRPIVFTVDHGLRPAAAGEAQLVGEWAKGLGLRHAVLRWEGEKPRSGIQEAARRARYNLLLQACEGAGAASLLTGHTLNDQIETVSMRLTRGSGEMGLAGMPSQSAPGEGAVRLVRPLLATSKPDLAAGLERAGQPYLTDPSNADPRFDRARLRAGEAATVEVSDIVAAQRARARIEFAAAEFLAAAVTPLPRGIAVAGLAGLPDDLLDTALSTMIRRMGRAEHPGTRAERRRIAEALRSVSVFGARTLAGALLRQTVARDGPHVRGQVVFQPERPGNLPFPGYWLPMGQFVQLAADGSFIAPGVAPN